MFYFICSFCVYCKKPNDVNRQSFVRLLRSLQGQASCVCGVAHTTFSPALA